MKEIVIFGTGGHSKVVFDAVQKQGLCKVKAFVSLNENMSEFLGVPHVLQTELHKLELNSGVVAIGDNYKRSLVVDFIKTVKPDFDFVTVVHPSAVLADQVTLGAGAVVLAQAVVNSFSRIGEHAILNTSCSVDHDCVLNAYSSIAPGAVLGGNVHIGSGSAVSIGAVIKHGCKVGSNSVLGAGAVLLKDLQDNCVAYGTPAQFVRARIAGDSYL